ncbi:MAG: D-alanyl-D-alanine carboxypeptidase [Alphaproteobacteria bacterium]|nr:MAG: D-alanyl-D-alanine carboxypeptidase [Alphaproteobacteria bacterium]
MSAYSLFQRGLALFLLASILLALFVPSPGRAQGFTTAAKHAILIEQETGTVLYEKAADERFPPASMAKMMTLYILFEQIHSGALSLDDTTRVSSHAWKRWAGSEGSLMFLSENEEVSVEQLIRGIIVASGNDACTVVAEMLAGSEDAFAQWMNAKAEELGMTNSHYRNASGWPAPDQYTTARDLALLADRTIRDFPELYHYYGEKTFTHGRDFRTGQPITQHNRNPLLYRVEGADGLKTGHTKAAGYGLTGSAKRGDRRLIVVVSGLSSQSERSRESQALIEYGFRAFRTYPLFAAGEPVVNADVWLGEAAKVPLVVENSLVLTLSRRDRAGMKVKVRYAQPIPAPIVKGDRLGELVITWPSRSEPLVVPLLAGESVAQVGGFGKIAAAFEYLVFGSSGTREGAAQTAAQEKGEGA